MLELITNNMLIDINKIKMVSGDGRIIFDDGVVVNIPASDAQELIKRLSPSPTQQRGIRYKA